MPGDPFDLERFTAAQDPVFAAVRAQLRAGRKTSHWMWFVFPQHVALGRSATARRYGIGSLAEARAYLAHPVLGPRLLECCGLLLALPPAQADAHAIFGSPDDVKLRSCLTLFGAADPGEPVFRQCLQRYFGGDGDAFTTQLVG